MNCLRRRLSTAVMKVSMHNFSEKATSAVGYSCWTYLLSQLTQGLAFLDSHLFQLESVHVEFSFTPNLLRRACIMRSKVNAFPRRAIEPHSAACPSSAARR